MSRTPDGQESAPGPAPTASSLFLEYAKAQSRIKDVDAELREIGAGLYELGDYLKSDTIGLPDVHGKAISVAANTQVRVTATQRVADLITEHGRLLERQRVLRRDLERTAEGTQLLKAVR